MRIARKPCPACAPAAGAPRGRGRPADPAKREAILDAARTLFLREGYGATSMDAIAATAGVAKQTVYKAFPTKEALFGAIVNEKSVAITAPLVDHAPDAPPAEVLSTVARHYLDLVLGPHAVPLLRTLAAERTQFPGLAETFYASGPAVTLARIASYLEEETAAGRLAVPNPRLAAEQFLGMLLGHGQICGLLDIPPPVPVSREERIASAVRIFLAAYGANAVQPSP